jgi:putative ABC transport system permease protein
VLQVQRRTSLALANLLVQPARTAISVGGVAFAVLLMLMQLGFLGTIQDTATRVYEQIPFDIVIRSREYLHLYEPRSIPEEIWRQVAPTPGVVETRLLDIGLGDWQNPRDGSFRGIAMIGIDPSRPAINVLGIEPLLELLSRPNMVLIDRASRQEFGPSNDQQFGSADVGTATDLFGKRVVIGGTYFLGTGLAANGALIISRAGYAERTPGHRDRVSLVLLQVDPRFDAARVAAAVKEKLKLSGMDQAAEVLLRKDTFDYELNRWVWKTPIGLIFVSGVVLAFVVGAMICYMVLATDVMGRLTEYATLKAMGYRDTYLAMVVMQQAWYLAAIAFVASVPVSLMVYRVTSYLAGISIEMTLGRLLGVAALTLFACSVAAFMALRKLTRAEPASLF